MIDYKDPAQLRAQIKFIDDMLLPTEELCNLNELTRPLVEAAREALPHWMERAEAAEAQLVNQYASHSFCESVECPGYVMSNEQCHECMAYRFHQYLRDHNMIREAE